MTKIWLKRVLGIFPSKNGTGQMLRVRKLLIFFYKN